MHSRRIVITLVFALLVSACGSGGDNSASAQSPDSYVYTPPVDQVDGWEVGHLSDNGFDADEITKMVVSILDGTNPGIDSVVIARNGKLLLEENIRVSLDQYDGWIGNTMPNRHIMHSTSKSVTSALIGIAIDQGYIASTDVAFYNLFNYGSYDNWDPRKAAMTLDDALTMRLGLVWDEWSAPYGDPANDLEILTSRYPDYAKALLDLPMESDPGTTYAYNTAATIAIGEALQLAVGVPMADFAETHLFDPLQIETAAWGTTPTGLPNGGSGLFLESRDMAKFGQLFIDGGTWNGQQIISAAWVSVSVQRHVDLNWSNTSGYGYQWWRDRFSLNGQPLESWSTRGFGGQYIFCIPALDLVVAFTGKNYSNGLADIPFRLMQDFVLDAIQTAT